MFVINHKSIFLSLGIIIVIASVFAVAAFGLNLGIDFTGGALLEVSYPALANSGDSNDFHSAETTASTDPDAGPQNSSRPVSAIVHEHLDALGLGAYSLQPTGPNGYILKMRPLSDDNERLMILEALSLDGQSDIVEERFTMIGPTLGAELKRKAVVGLATVLIMIIIFIAWAFRKVSRPLSSWKYGVVAIITLVHDVVIPTGVFALLGQFIGVEVDLLFLTALLAILGYSINDTIVVFDRIRENLANSYRTNLKEGFGEIVGRSLKETYARSINTSLTTALVLCALLIFGSPATFYFALVLLIGIVAGTYSSIFIASPLLVMIYERFGVKSN
jgi:preprotein translocase subunit SecF